MRFGVEGDLVEIDRAGWREKQGMVDLLFVRFPRLHSDRLVFAGQGSDVAFDFGAISDSRRDKPGALAILEMDFGAPKPIAMAGSRIAMDLVDHTIEIGPGKPVAVVAGQAVLGEDSHGAGTAAAHEPKNGRENDHGNDGPDDGPDSEAVSELKEVAQGHKAEEESEHQQADVGDLVRLNLEAGHCLRLSESRDE